MQGYHLEPSAETKSAESEDQWDPYDALCEILYPESVQPSSQASENS